MRSCCRARGTARFLGKDQDGRWYQKGKVKPKCFSSLKAVPTGSAGNPPSTGQRQPGELPGRTSSIWWLRWLSRWPAFAGGSSCGPSRGQVADQRGTGARQCWARRARLWLSGPVGQQAFLPGCSVVPLSTAPGSDLGCFLGASRDGSCQSFGT